MKVCIDAGHGGIDSGAVLGSRKEADDVLKIALEVESTLKRHNVEVVMTRRNNSTVSLSERTNIESLNNVDYFVSIHRNAFDKIANGIETYSISETGKGRELAVNIHSELARLNIFNDRKVKTSGFYVLKNTKSPACLIELGFIDNIKDNSIFDSNLKAICKAVSVGILKQLNIPFMEEEAKKQGYRVVVGYFEEYNNAEAKVNELSKKGINSYIVKHNL